jgi:Fic family protein
MEKLVQPLLNATESISRYDQTLTQIHNSEILISPLRRQETIVSSRMEGTVSTMDEILAYEADYDENNSENNEVRSEIIETILYERSLKTAQIAIEKGYPISEYLIKSIHQQLLSYGRGASKSPGEYKTEQNYLTDHTKKKILFTPISPESLKVGMEELFAYIDHARHPPLIKIAIAHIEFEALHPFKDGNGRIGRMLITLMLWHYKIISNPYFYISDYMENNKDIYIDTMRNVSKNNDWDSWCIFFCQAINIQAKKNLEITKNILSLYEDLKLKFPKILQSTKSIAVLDYIFKNPIFRNSKLRDHLDVSPPTSLRFVNKLVENKLLNIIEQPSGQTSGLYRFEALMRIVRI